MSVGCGCDSSGRDFGSEGNSSIGGGVEGRGGVAWQVVRVERDA